MGVIKVNDIAIYAYHGCLEEEARIGGNYSVNIEIQTNFDEAAHTDDLSKTIDYCTINSIVENQMAIRSKLIEHVGQRIYNNISLEFTEIERLSVEIIKISPPINGNVKSVSIIIDAR